MEDGGAATLLDLCLAVWWGVDMVAHGFGPEYTGLQVALVCDDDRANRRVSMAARRFRYLQGYWCCAH